MRLLVCIYLVCILHGAGASTAAQFLSEREQVLLARKRLADWEDGHLKPGQRTVHLVCWTPSDRVFPENDQQRLSRIMRHIQAFYADEMARHGFGPRTFNLQTDIEGQVVLHRVTGKQPTKHYKRDSGREIRSECLATLQMQGIDANKETIVIFCNLAFWDEKQLRFRHESPYYAGGSFRSGTAWQLDSPELDIGNLKLKQPMIQDAQYGRISLGKHNSIFIGGIAHELGHALGLPHGTPRPDEQLLGNPLMGSGNRSYGDELRHEGRGAILSFAHALRLASHPQFSESVRGFDATITSTVTDLRIVAKDRFIEVTGDVSGEPPLYGVVAYFDPEGNSDYNATTATAIPDEQGRFALRTEALARGKRGQLRLVLLHCNGAVTGASEHPELALPYRISASGEPNLTTAKTRLELADFLDALAEQDHVRASELLSDIELPRAKELATALLNPAQRRQPPSLIDRAETSIALSHCKASTAKVGWARVNYDRLPEKRANLESAGELFAAGIYAHAPAQHRYELGGKWHSLQGIVGLAAGYDGSVIFEIFGDGKSLWKSEVVKSEQLWPFNVDITGVDTLELRTYPTDDGPARDWGLWLEPTLKRSSEH